MVHTNARRLERIHQRVVEWYREYARDLPWRRTRDPYAIIVAEIMLQQTQVERVIPRWHAWLEQFPTLRSLAQASKADAIRGWQGLGYNLRALRLHAIAQEAVERFDGQLPADLGALQSLKGVGRYTAGAVACFAFEHNVAMVETNIRRVLGRVFGVPLASATAAQALAERVLPAHEAYAWNQALMDIGAMLCRPREPLCLVCPLVHDCVGRSAASAPSGVRRETLPFADSDRFVRGRIVDALRVGDRLRTEVVTDTRSARVLARLLADGLVVDGGDGYLRLPA